MVGHILATYTPTLSTKIMIAIAHDFLIKLLNFDAGLQNVMRAVTSNKQYTNDGLIE